MQTENMCGIRITVESSQKKLPKFETLNELQFFLSWKKYREKGNVDKEKKGNLSVSKVSEEAQEYKGNCYMKIAAYP